MAMLLDFPHRLTVGALSGAVAGVEPSSPFLACAPFAIEAERLSGADYRDVSLALRRGELIGLTGAEGSGYLNVARVLAGMTSPHSGVVRLPASDGHAVTLPGGNRNAAMALGVRCVPQDGDTGEQVPAALSCGERLTLALARALAADPKVLILIEPAAGVDLRTQDMISAMAEHARDAGCAVVLASSELDGLRGCDRLFVMSRGRIAAEFGPFWGDREVLASIEGDDCHER
ncbi:hypothetical protein WKR88_13205 [Trinickia caryophylli]|uniref:ABC transporter domain-containing protein n=1 Tax=Trinickia caryophylli TaxID=28094 RepID=A0A1X7H649_TRICW|nr:hypothetical protein [Trinickia caryophylli]PMS09609.1 hypothetical protein C0Z17_24250 [Trinickia caryophylli]TRX17254.1 hypothetical protein FNF07_02735 [Trinickia caryophylli]WQE12011.1 hypothetical protein U0034_00830 [Trinickia caryophylli]SMF79771.1 hypothetical protein SAMN06295900_12191 [Trinickia caryophylli]GLU35597.1 hypothetical protein Busp01_54390 [Trinickia caryophylli]